MPKIIPIRDLKDTTAISRMCNESDEPIFVTKNGYGDMVVMSMKAYEEIIETSIIDNAIAESEAQLEQDGKLYDAKEVLETLRREYFG